MVAKPILTTGVALATATAIVAATPAILPKETEKTYVATTSAPLDPALRQLSVADYQLMAVTFPGLLQAFFNGYGKEVTDDTLVLGPLGALYYLLDQGVLAEVDVDDHFFERGPYAAAGHIAREAGFEELAEFLEGPWEDLRETIVETVNRLTGGTGDLDDEDPNLTFVAELVRGFLFNGGPLGVVRVIVDKIKQAFDPDEPEAVVLNESAIQRQATIDEPELPKPEGPESVRFDADPDPEPAEKVEVVEPGSSGPNPPAEVKIPSFLPEKAEVQAPTGQAGAIQNFQPSAAPQPEVEQPEVEQPEAPAVEAPAEVSKTKTELRREAAKERREALKERVNDVRDKVKDVVERATGANNDDQGDDDGGDGSGSNDNNDNNDAGGGGEG